MVLLPAWSLYLISNRLELLSLGKSRFDTVMLNQLRDQVAEHRLAMRDRPVEAAKVLSVMHRTCPKCEEAKKGALWARRS